MAEESTQSLEKKRSLGKKSAPLSKLGTIGISQVEKVKGVSFAIEIRNVVYFIEECHPGDRINYDEKEHIRLFMIYKEIRQYVNIDKNGLMTTEDCTTTLSIPRTARLRDVISPSMLAMWELTQEDLLMHEIFDVFVYPDKGDRC